MPDDQTQQTPTVEAAFDKLLRALRCAALDNGDDFDRIASYRRAVERMAKRYGLGVPLTERGAKGEA